MKFKTLYCHECQHPTEHVIWTEDALGCESIARVFSSIISLGVSNIACTTYCKCTVCGETNELY